VVANNDLRLPKVETVANGVRKLQSEQATGQGPHPCPDGRDLRVERMAAEIAEGGDAYPAGVRDLARRFAEDAEARVQTLEAITART